MTVESEPIEDPTWRVGKRGTFAIWSLNSIAMLLVGFLAILMIRDRETYLFAVCCFSVALGCSYVSVRVRFNVVGVILLLAVVWFYATFLRFYLSKVWFQL